jgi:hypothetical protein
MLPIRLAAIVIIAGVSIGLVVGRFMGPPHQSLVTPEHYCELFAKVRANLTVDFGMRVDSKTRLSDLEVICDDKALVFHHDVDLKSPQIDDEWVAQRKLRWSKTYCSRHPSFSNAMRAGWKIATVLTLSDGTALRIEAECHDGEA